MLKQIHACFNQKYFFLVSYHIWKKYEVMFYPLFIMFSKRNRVYNSRYNNDTLRIAWQSTVAIIFQLSFRRLAGPFSSARNLHVSPSKVLDTEKIIRTKAWGDTYKSHYKCKWRKLDVNSKNLARDGIHLKQWSGNVSSWVLQARFKQNKYKITGLQILLESR